MTEHEDGAKDEKAQEKGGPLCKYCYFPESEHGKEKEGKRHCKGGIFSTTFEPLSETQIVGPKFKRK